MASHRRGNFWNRACFTPLAAQCPSCTRIDPLTWLPIGLQDTSSPIDGDEFTQEGSGDLQFLAEPVRSRYPIVPTGFLPTTTRSLLAYATARFPAFAEITVALQGVWPWGEAASVEEIKHRLGQQWPVALVEAAIWKTVADAAARGPLLVDLEKLILNRTLLPPDAAPLVPDTLFAPLPVVELRPTLRASS